MLSPRALSPSPIAGGHHRSNSRSKVARCGARLTTAAAYAAHPLISEDAATQGRGGFELEIGNAWTRDDNARSYEFGPQLSYGVTRELDAIIRPTWLDVRFMGNEDRTRSRGVGDTAVDAKWRFWESRAIDLAVRAGVSAPTGDTARGLGSGKPTYHALLVASLDAFAGPVAQPLVGVARDLAVGRQAEADHGEVRRQRAVHVEVVHRRQQLAPGQVAVAAEDDQDARLGQQGLRRAPARDLGCHATDPFRCLAPLSPRGRGAGGEGCFAFRETASPPLTPNPSPPRGEG